MWRNAKCDAEEANQHVRAVYYAVEFESDDINGLLVGALATTAVCICRQADISSDL